MNEIAGWFTGLLTIGGFLYFLAGFGMAYLVECIRARVKHKQVKIPWHLAGIAVGIVAILVTSLQSQVAYSTAKETADEVQACQKEFNQALRDRTRITMENDEVSQEQRRILYAWLHDLIFPPPPYDKMDTNDPERQAYGISLTIAADSKLKKSFARQDQLQSEREAKPLPDPTCGKS